MEIVWRDAQLITWIEQGSVRLVIKSVKEDALEPLSCAKGAETSLSR